MWERELRGHTRFFAQIDLGGLAFDETARSIEILASDVLPVVRREIARLTGRPRFGDSFPSCGLASMSSDRRRCHEEGTGRSLGAPPLEMIGASSRRGPIRPGGFHPRSFRELRPPHRCGIEIGWSRGSSRYLGFPSWDVASRALD